MAEIDILVGTVYGSAMLVAETLSEHLQARGHLCRVYDEAELEDIDSSRFLLLITATTGQGDIPPNLQAFASALTDRAPYMKGWRYALIAMGDSSYEHFCGAGRQLDALLQELAAEPLVPHLEIDATLEDEPEVAAMAWLKSWENKL
ncbi:flavodoxin [Aeromonas tecta]|uniref:flavodoxin n=1 Tax=Aeromonas tecta TaxID=324617 RepID=UPI000682FB5B|nr:flavodoxin [Aeromonas tecta]